MKSPIRESNRVKLASGAHDSIGVVLSISVNGKVALVRFTRYEAAIHVLVSELELVRNPIKWIRWWSNGEMLVERAPSKFADAMYKVRQKLQFACPQQELRRVELLDYDPRGSEPPSEPLFAVDQDEHGFVTEEERCVRR